MPLPFMTHWLRRNHGTSVPSLGVAMHVSPVERAVPGNPKRRYQKLGLGAARFWRWDGGKQQRREECWFSTPEDFWTWMQCRAFSGRGVWLVAYNVGHVLTWLQFWDLLDAGEYKLSEQKHGRRAPREDVLPDVGRGNYVFCSNDPPTIIQAKHKTHFLTALDLRNYFDESIDDIAAWCGKPRLPRPLAAAGADAWQAYAMREAEIVDAACGKLMTWWDRGAMGVFRHTAPALALAHYRHAHLKEPILIDDCEEARALSREALAAGECRLSFCGKVLSEMEYAGAMNGRRRAALARLRCGPIHVVDCNSLYPSVMRGNLFPRKLVAYKPDGCLDDLAVWSDTLCLVARVHLRTPDVPYPVRLDGKRWYAVGDYWTTLAGPELLDAYERGLVVDVHEIAAYLPGRLFTSYVDALYAQKVAAKKAQDPCTERFVKLLLNALPGKFSQRGGGWDWSDYPSPGPRWGSFLRKDPTDAHCRRYRVISGHVQAESDPLDTIDTLPAIGAFVHAYGRLAMRGVRRRLPAESILYQDTDSLHLLGPGLAALEKAGLMDEWRLGAFRLEATAQSGVYRGPKDYTLDGVHVVAGRKADAEDVGETRFEQDEAQTLDSILGDAPGGVLIVERVEKRMGKWHPDGVVWLDGRVTPPRLCGHELDFRPPGAAGLDSMPPPPRSKASQANAGSAPDATP